MNLSKTYDPKAYEDSLYKLWESSKAFVSDNQSKKAHFSAVLPPPNANGDLHVGHSLMFAIQDTMARYQRMQGKEVLWLPGADHAGFETQVVYEKHLAKEGKSRFDFNREELYQQIWKFVDKNKENYLAQFRKLGASVDWSKFTFTLDQKIIDQAYTTFKKLWDDGLIYRGERLVNFCTFHGTAFADIEVEYKQLKGNLWYIKYPLTNQTGSITVATTRPETMLGDVAVAVNPTDTRYSHMVGKTVTLPITGREIPVISDTMVDPNFGTGAVKITPAHDPNDYAVAERHNLPKITVIGHDGLMTPEAGKHYMKLDVASARKQVISDLTSQGLVEKTEKHENSVGHCYKCGTIIQPLLKEQWFIDMEPLAKPAIKALKEKQITFYPDSKRTQLIAYLENLKDWNISRQIVWGIPIPAFQSEEDPTMWIFDTQTDQPTITKDGKTYRRDPDVFDTWFSSSSWPYATLEKGSDDYDKFYPNSLMETGGEILYPWVSRMIMLGLYETGKIPFETVYIHGYVLASDGTKMSKSVGNVISPMAMIETYGADALRLGLMTDRAPGINRPFDEMKLVGGRNFANKLWNIARYVHEKIGEKTYEQPNPASPADHWILHRLNQATTNIAKDLDTYKFSEAFDTAYKLVWHDFADWYIEASKSELNSSILHHVLLSILKMVHPFAPFVTEAIWQQTHTDNSLLANQQWPTEVNCDNHQTKQFETIKEIVTEIRVIQKLLAPQDKTIYSARESLVIQSKELIEQLTKYSVKIDEKNLGNVRLASSESTTIQIEPDKIAAYQKAIKQQISEAEQLANTLSARLSNTSYVSNAPKHIVAETQQQLDTIHSKLDELRAELQRFAASK